MLNGLDLFSGIGGLSLALEPWVRPIAFCENDRYCQGVLLSRMSERLLPIAPIWDDVQTLKGAYFQGHMPSIIYGGFPCQDISVAGTGIGLGGERSGLFYQVMRLSEELKPTWIFLENVPAIRTRGLRSVVRELTDLGYDCRWTRVSAAEIGAPHIRQRWFLLAHSQCQQSGVESRRWSGPSRKKAPDVVDFLGWDSKPPNNRVCDGLPEELDRIKGLGNAVVPIQAREAFKRLMGL